jgi:hypothetical protein
MGILTKRIMGAAVRPTVCDDPVLRSNDAPKVKRYGISDSLGNQLSKSTITPLLDSLRPQISEERLPFTYEACVFMVSLLQSHLWYSSY